MADGSIVIQTLIETAKAKKSLATLTNQMTNTAKRIDTLRSKFDFLNSSGLKAQLQSAKNEVVSLYDTYRQSVDAITEKQQALNTQIVEQDKHIISLRANLSKLKEDGANDSEIWQVSSQIQAAEQVKKELLSGLEPLKADLFALGESYNNQIKAANEKVNTLTQSIEKYKSTEAELKNELSQAESELGSLNQDYDEQEAHLEELKDANISFGQVAKSAAQGVAKVFNSLSSVVKSFAGHIKSIINGLKGFISKIISLGASLKQFASRLKTIVSDHLPKMREETQKTTSSFKQMLKGLIGIGGITMLFRKLREGVASGLEELSKESESFKDVIYGLKASLETLQNAFTAAFIPIIQAVIPYIQQLCAWLTAALDSVAQFSAAILGQTSYRKAVIKTTKALKDEEAAQRGLSNLDKLNNLSSDKGSKKSKAFADFEEVPITSKFKGIAEKAKKILSDIFSPIKKAWDKVGKYVIDSWKKTVSRMKSLLGSIWKDFIAVWKQSKTVKIFEDIFKIIGHIISAVGNLAKQFEKAWNKNKTGKKILEGIRDLIKIITGRLEIMARATRNWADKLNFSPLLEAINKWLKSMKPVVDNLMGILQDFYTKVLLPLAKWTIEKGLPELVDVFTRFNDKVDWQKLRTNLSKIWEALEPFAERIGEGLIYFIDQIAQKIADFINSEQFSAWCDNLAAWFDSITQEDINGFFDGVISVLEGFGQAVKDIFGFLSDNKDTFIDIFSKIKDIIEKLINTLVDNKDKIFDALGKVLDFVDRLISGDYNSQLESLAKGLAAVCGAVLGFKAVLGIMKAITTVSNFLGIFGVGSAAASGAAGGGAMLGTATAGVTGLAGAFTALGSAIAVAAAAIVGFKIGDFVGMKLLDDKDREFVKSVKEDGGYLKYIFGNGFGEGLKDIGGAFKLMWQDAIGQGDEAMKEMHGLKQTTEESMAKVKETSTTTASDVAKATENMKTSFAEMQKTASDTKSTEAMKTFKETTTVSMSQANSSMEDTKLKVQTLKQETANSFSTMSTESSNSMKKLTNETTSSVNQIKSSFNSLSSVRSNIISMFSTLRKEISSTCSQIQNNLKAISNTNISVRSTNASSNIRGYASGQVIPTSMKQHLAILGDNNTETEVVSPLSTIQQALVGAMQQMGGFGGGNNGDIVINIDGREVFRVVQKQAQEQTRMTGRPAW